MAYFYKTRVHMADTDATGALYFSKLQEYAVEAFEAFLIENHLREILLPIVHVEADYIKPLRLWDEVLVEVIGFQVGTTSLTVQSEIKGYGAVKIVHVHVDAKGQKLPIPQVFLDRLSLCSMAGESSESGA